jgi:ATP-dependent protease ClpP protease subunit
MEQATTITTSTEAVFAVGDIIHYNLFGPIVDLVAYGPVLKKLAKFSSNYSTIVVNISSEGGDVEATQCIIDTIMKYQHVITRAISKCYSSAFTVWLIGDERFCYPYTSFMFHRERFGSFGKYKENAEMIEHLRKMHDVYLQEVGILQLFTQDDVAKMEYTDVYILGQELINKHICNPIIRRNSKNSINLPGLAGGYCPSSEPKGGGHVQNNNNTQEER